jgi:hypothetical protein
MQFLSFRVSTPQVYSTVNLVEINCCLLGRTAKHLIDSKGKRERKRLLPSTS